MSHSHRNKALAILSALCFLIFVFLPIGCDEKGQSPVEAPAGMTISAPSFSSGEFIVTLSYPWPESGSSQDAYTLEESTVFSSGFVQIATSPEGAWHQTFSFPLNRPTGTYSYRARAWVNAAPSAYSSEATVVVTSTDIPRTFYPTYTNILRYSSVDASRINTVDTTSDLSIGSNYSFGTTHEYVATHSATLLRFDVLSIIGLKTILEAKLILYPRSLPKDSVGIYRAGATTLNWVHASITWATWFARGGVYEDAQDSTGSFVAPRTTDMPLQIDVTAIVRKWAKGTWPAFGFQVFEPNLRLPDPPVESNRVVTFESDKTYMNLSHRPQLFVRYK